MQYRCLGNSGLQVSVFSLGTWVTWGEQVDAELAYSLATTAYAAGVNFFDTAEVYGGGAAETILGAVIARGIAEGVWTRSDLVISTKLFFGDQSSTRPNRRGLSRKHITQGLAASLARLRLDYVDIVFAHRADPHTPLAETVAAFSAAIDRGHALYWGTSMWPAARIAGALAEASATHRAPPVVEQPEYNLFTRTRVEQEYAPFTALCDGAAVGQGGVEATITPRRTLGLTIWSPLADGVLTNKYAGGVAPAGSRMALGRSAAAADRLFRGPDAFKVRAAAALAAALPRLGLDCSVAQAALAWTVASPAVSSCILGATCVAQLEENLGAMAVVPRLTPDVRAQVDRVMADFCDGA